MNKNLFDPHMKSLEEMEMPRDLHAKIMKRVFIAGYGRYLYLSSAVLFINLAVLSFELYRKLASVDYGRLAESLSESFAWSTVYQTLPIQTMVATGITAALCAYMTSLFMKLHTNSSMSFGFFRRSA
jgi:hypothetical protein